MTVCPARYLCGFIPKLTRFSFPVEIPFGYKYDTFLYTANCSEVPMLREAGCYEQGYGYFVGAH